jgi:uncharacterized protein
MIPRQLAQTARTLFAQYPVLTLTGPRQSGKTTLARALFDLPYANLEAPDLREYALADPRSFLGQYPNGVILDEIQRVPDLVSYIQVLVDEQRRNGMYVLTGSQNFSIREVLSQSLAGRTALLTLLPLSLEELQAAGLQVLDIAGYLYRGFYPRAITEQIEPSAYYRDYVATYVERDLRQLSLVKDLAQFQTFLRLCASNIGQVLNLNRIASDCGISQTTATQWLTLLEASYVLTRLQPFHSNTRKRLVKRPKLYFYDTGLAAYLLSIGAPSHIASHPLQGSLFENLVVMEVLKYLCNHNHSPQLYFYRDSDGNEVDLLIPVGERLLPVEIKLGKTISQDFFKGFARFETAMNVSCPDKLLVYGGDQVQQRSDGTAVLPLANLAVWLQQSYGTVG